MTTEASRYVRAARCPPTLKPQQFGLWQIERRGYVPGTIEASIAGGICQTILYRVTEATLHREPGEIVMEDSLQELRRHLPIWLAASGRILMTGLGLGCVVRGLLASPHVSHIDVIEIDPGIIRAIGPEFASEPRVTITEGDALSCPFPAEKWDMAWHDIWCEDSKQLHTLHVDLMKRFVNHCEAQGAWMFPRDFKRYWRRHPDLTWRLLG